jgi:hypothetical protein
MALGAGAIALSSAKANEQSRWREAAERETRRYGLDSNYVQSRFMGEQPTYKRTWLDFLLIAIAVAVIVFFARVAEVPQIQPHWGTMAALVVAMLLLAIPAVIGLWRTSRLVN